jgi:hypothetical protein
MIIAEKYSKEKYLLKVLEKMHKESPINLKLFDITFEGTKIIDALPF